MVTGAALFGGAWRGAPSARLPHSMLAGGREHGRSIPFSYEVQHHPRCRVTVTALTSLPKIDAMRSRQVQSV